MPKNKKSKKSGGGGGNGTGGGGRSDAWQELRGSTTVTPTKMDTVQEIVDTATNPDNLPDRNVLVDMVNKAGNLSFKGDGKGRYGESLKGILFHIAEYTTQGGTSSKTKLFDDFVSHKSGSGVCYENSFLPVARRGNGHIIIHQSLAPCSNCCNGFKAWAGREGCTIVVSYDKGYDGSGGDGCYVFASDGKCFGL